LKRLYQSPSDEIKVRALVGLCKLGSTGGTDSSWKPFEDGANLKLADACRRFLLNPKKDLSIQKWAIEGLSYLTLDAEVKEKLTEVRISPCLILCSTMKDVIIHGAHFFHFLSLLPTTPF